MTMMTVSTGSESVSLWIHVTIVGQCHYCKRVTIVDECYLLLVCANHYYRCMSLLSSCHCCRCMSLLCHVFAVSSEESSSDVSVQQTSDDTRFSQSGVCPLQEPTRLHLLVGAPCRLACVPPHLVRTNPLPCVPVT